MEIILIVVIILGLAILSYYLGYKQGEKEKKPTEEEIKFIKELTNLLTYDGKGDTR